MKAGYIQTRPAFGRVEANVDRAMEMLREMKADLAVLPEFFNTGYFFTDRDEVERLSEAIPGGPTCRRLMDAAREMGFYVAAGLPERDGDIFYNSAVLVGPGGYVAHYRKIHLYNEEKLFFEPGNMPFRVFDLGFCRLGMMICYDWIYPESMRVLSILGADLVAHPSNLVLPYCPSVMPARCLENRVFAITANRAGSDRKNGRELAFIGQSQVTAPGGQVLSRASGVDEGWDVVEIDVSQARTKSINDYNDLFQDRRPEMYGPITGRA
jgi:predicted amidohydrolase